MGKYKHGKQTKPIEFEVFQKIMEQGQFCKRSHKSFFTFLYWFGVRVSEAIIRVKEDFAIKEEVMIIYCPSLKHGTREYLKAPTNLPYMPLILEDVERTRKQRKVWDFSRITGWAIVKRVMPNYYPHFFRLNRAVHFLDDPTTTLPEMQSWFGWKTPKAIESYLGYSERHLDKQASRLKDDLKKPPKPLD